MPRSARLPLLVVLLFFSFVGSSRASRVVVPDDTATIQKALDGTADTVIVRAGPYPERISISRPVLLTRENTADGEHPQVLGLDVWMTDAFGGAEVRGFHIRGSALVHNRLAEEMYSPRLSFDGCRFDSSLVTDFTHNVIALHVSRSVVRGTLFVRVLLATFDADTILGVAEPETGGQPPSGVLVDSRGEVNVSRCLIAGPGWSGIYLDGERNVRIIDSTIRGYGVGVYQHAHEGPLSVVGNRIAECGVGVSAGYMGGVRIADNLIEDCDTAIDAYGDVQLEMTNNRVLRSRSVGVKLLGGVVGPFRGNVIGRSGGDGLVLACRGSSIESNTFYLNSGSAIRMEAPGYASGGHTTISRNIGFGNGRYGVEWVSAEQGVLTCNDWYSNAMGDASGIVVGPDDRSLDPGFCDLADEEVSLRADSPLLSGSCGVVGARGLGCDVSSEVLVALLVAERTEMGIRIRWNLSGNEQSASAWIERATGRLGPWISIVTDRALDGSVTVDLDRNAEPDRNYWYRLGWLVEGRKQHSAAVESQSKAIPKFRITGVAPNPVGGEAVIGFSLSRPSDVRLALHDLMGREVASLFAGVRQRGNHAVRWSEIVGNKPMRPGMYFLRLSTIEGQESRRVIVRE